MQQEPEADEESDIMPAPTIPSTGLAAASLPIVLRSGMRILRYQADLMCLANGWCTPDLGMNLWGGSPLQEYL
jgi:hypothetical protein